MNRRAITFFAFTYLFSLLMWLPAVLMTYGMVAEASFLGGIAKPAGYLAGIGPTLVAFVLVAREGGKKSLLITLVLVSILITWVQNNTGGSLIPAFVFHTYINLSGEVVPLIERNREIQGDYTAWIIANVLLTAVVVGVVYRWGARTLTGRGRRPVTD